METNTHQLSATEITWQKIVLKYVHPDLKKSIWQICNSVIPYLILWFLMYKSLSYSYFLTILLAVIASGFLVRIFIIYHDCGHGSFFISGKANRIIGKIMGILTFTPYNFWHNQHRKHHNTSGNLDKRGVGDIWTMTVEEYLNSSKMNRFIYSAFRNPFIMFTIGPLFVIFSKNRFSKKSMLKKEKLNIYFTNIVILISVILISALIGFKAYLLIQFPIIFIAHIFGIWLFYIQHQFEEVSWEREDKWDYQIAAFRGSSFLKLPVVLQWFTGNIGFHHVHHLSPRIANYNLEACHYENDIFKNIKPVTILKTFRVLSLGLWDEAERKLISFKKLRVSLRELEASPV